MPLEPSRLAVSVLVPPIGNVTPQEAGGPLRCETATRVPAATPLKDSTTRNVVTVRPGPAVRAVSATPVKIAVEFAIRCSALLTGAHEQANESPLTIVVATKQMPPTTRANI